MDIPASHAAPLILEIKGNSLDDGPGIRSVVFYKGCPLSCVWCHNPESKRAAVELSFDTNVCINCGACRNTCPEDALSLDNRYYVDRSKCTLCFQCLDICPSNALERVGRPMSVDAMLEKILPDKPFFDASGGGVTLSGGEPTLYMAFTSQLVHALKQEKIHTLLETCGFFHWDRFMEMLYLNIDAIYFDFKLIDRNLHKHYCGQSNEKILDNFERLLNAAKQDGKHLLPRIPLIPDITDTETNIRGIAAFLKRLDIDHAALLEYNPLWPEKNKKIGANTPSKAVQALASFSERSVLERCRAIFEASGIKT